RHATNADPRLRLGSERKANMYRLVARATAVPRPAKLARQTSQARYSSRSGALGESRTPGWYVLRAYQDCRAGSAGRDMQVVRATGRATLASGSDPRRSLGSVL